MIIFTWKALGKLKVMPVTVAHLCVLACAKLSKSLYMCLHLIFTLLNNKHYFQIEGEEPQRFNIFLKATTIK